MKFPTYEEMGKEIAEKALDEYLYKGKTLREWIEIIIAEKQTDTAEWILCKDRLPSNNEPFYVLCCDKYGELLMAHPFEDESSNTGYSAESEDFYMYDAVAWCIIQPYKAVTE